MKQNIVKILREIFPFVLTIALWRLSFPWLNPAGILAIIPIFYCSFIRPIRYWTFFAIIMCFLIDYKFNTLFIWTFFYCAYYSIMNIQTMLDLTHTKENGLYAFALFLGIAALFITILHINFGNLLAAIIMFLITCAFYIPIIRLIWVVQNDR